MPIVLVGNKIDLRYDIETVETLLEWNQTTVKYDEGKEVAKKIKAFDYVECSSKTLEVSLINMQLFFAICVLSFITASTKQWPMV